MGTGIEHGDTDNDQADVPWEEGVFDAHCHPTDTMASIDHVPHMKARGFAIMATRREDQDLVNQVAIRFAQGDKELWDRGMPRLLIPAFGWHPWFSYQIFDDRSNSEKPNARTHYQAVLSPKPEDEFFLGELPEPQSLTAFLHETEQRLQRHPWALVGEVGLDKAFRLPTAWLPETMSARDTSQTPGSREGRTLSPYRVQAAHQKLVLEAQLRLAARFGRPVSIHSVQAHGAVYEVLSKLWAGYEKMSCRQRKRRSSAAGAHALEEDQSDPGQGSKSPRPFPPRVCMHSYSGPVDFIREFLKPSVPVEVYFSFSQVINFAGPSSDKAIGAIEVVPDSRILIESDLHRAGPEMDDRLSSILQRVCDIKKWSSAQGVKILRENWDDSDQTAAKHIQQKEWESRPALVLLCLNPGASSSLFEPEMVKTNNSRLAPVRESRVPVMNQLQDCYEPLVTVWES